AETRLQRLPFQVLHHQEVHAFVPADIVERANVWMVESSDCVRFAREAFAELLVADFYRNGAIQPRVTGAVDLPHPPSTNWREDFERSEASSRGEWHNLSDFNLSNLLMVDSA